VNGHRVKPFLEHEIHH